MKYVTTSSWEGIRLVEAKRYLCVYNGPVLTGGKIKFSALGTLGTLIVKTTIVNFYLFLDFH